MKIKPYIYALSKKNKCITAALSCQDAETAEQVYLDVSRIMKIDITDEFHFGCTSGSEILNSFEVDFENAEPELRIDFMSLPKFDYPRGMEVHKIFSIRKFEEAELRTKKILSESQHAHQRDIQFMHYVELALKGNTLPIGPETNAIDDFAWNRQLAEEERPKKKRRSRAERRGILEEAIDFQEEHLNMTDKAVEKEFGLERGALSKKRALDLKERRNKPKNSQRNRSVDKHVGDDFVHDNIGISKR